MLVTTIFRIYLLVIIISSQWKNYNAYTILYYKINFAENDYQWGLLLILIHLLSFSLHASSYM